jgi:hypothetical protein
VQEEQSAMMEVLAAACLALGIAPESHLRYSGRVHKDVHCRAPHCASCTAGCAGYDYRREFNYPWSIAPSVRYSWPAVPEETPVLEGRRRPVKPALRPPVLPLRR